MTLNESIIEQVAQLLGRKPRGLEAVAVASDNGEPMVIRVASLVDDKPFPTLFWLVDPQLCLRIGRLEATGLMASLQQSIDDDAALARDMRDDHIAHIALRDSYICKSMREAIDALGYGEVLATRGIGGIADFQRIRCLHTWYAAHLVVPNTVGKLLDAHWENYTDED